MFKTIRDVMGGAAGKAVGQRMKSMPNAGEMGKAAGKAVKSMSMPSAGGLGKEMGKRIRKQKGGSVSTGDGGYSGGIS